MGVMFMTDLDGTLLGHEDFSFAPIRSDILEMVRAGIMIVPNSSKTRGEITAFCDHNMPYFMVPRYSLARDSPSSARMARRWSTGSSSACRNPERQRMLLVWPRTA